MITLRAAKWLSQLSRFLKSQGWYEPARRAFWSDPDRLMAIKATLAMAFLAIPMVLAGKPFFAVSLALGVLAGALSETDDHPRGRIKSLALKVVAFGVSSLSVSLLNPYPWLLGLGLASSTFVYLLLGGLSERYRGVTFGAVLVGIYAMIGAEMSPAWYWQPILLPAGALFYGLFSLWLLFLHPWRLLEEQLARGFLALGRYIELKAALFPSDEKTQAKVRNQLALQNVKVVAALDQCRDVLNSYRDQLPSDEALADHMRTFMLLQSLHERAASSHERYEKLSLDPSNRALMEGLGQLMLQLAFAVRLFARSLLTRIPYRHPVSLGWLVSVLNEKLANTPSTPVALQLLLKNLEHSHRSLQLLSDELVRTVAPRLARDQRSLFRRFTDQLTWNNPRMRHAARLSLCFLTGFAISEFFQLRKGEWVILTSLFVLQPTYSETRRRLLQRILGTLSGVVFGVVFIQLLPTAAGELVFLLASAFAFFFWLRKNYSVSVIFITTFVLCAFNLVSKQGAVLMLPRLADTLIGSGLAYLSVRLIWPDWQYQRLPSLLESALRANAAYLRAILEEYRRPPDGDDLPYRIARRAAHRADNALVLAWQDMQLEPGSQRRLLDHAFDLTYLNHALLSYLSALGAHRRQHSEGQTGVSPRAEEVLAALEGISGCLESGRKKEDCPLQGLLEELQRNGGTQSDGPPNLQRALLTNVAEVVLQITQLAPEIRKTGASV